MITSRHGIHERDINEGKIKRFVSFVAYVNCIFIVSLYRIHSFTVQMMQCNVRISFSCLMQYDPKIYSSFVNYFWKNISAVYFFCCLLFLF